MQQNGQEQQERKRLQPTAEQQNEKAKSHSAASQLRWSNSLRQSSRRWRVPGPAAANPGGLRELPASYEPGAG